MQFGSIKTEKGDFLIEIESDTINCVNVCEEDITTLVRVVLVVVPTKRSKRRRSAVHVRSKRANNFINMLPVAFHA